LDDGLIEEMFHDMHNVYEIKFTEEEKWEKVD
jgi:hypothetical protein